MNSWIDIPIIQAINYFENILYWFLGWARIFANVAGIAGICWTGFKLVNERMAVKEMLWDTIYKWLLFIALVNAYPAATSFIARFSNQIGLEAGNGSAMIARNFKNLRDRIKGDMDKYDDWKSGIEKELSDVSGVPVTLDFTYTDGRPDLSNVFVFANAVDDAKRKLPKAKRKAFEAEMEKKWNQISEEQQSIFGEQMLKAIDSILIVKDSEGEAEQDLTDSYVDLNIWLIDEDTKKETPYFSCGAILRIGLLAGQILWEKSKLYREGVGKNAHWYEFSKKSQMFPQQIANLFLAGISCICIIVSVAFAIIQYSMCVIEFAIIQGIGAFFIPFILFDGTKEMPKKLVPVFTGFLIKMIVMVICFMFIINLWLQFAADQISPDAGSMSWPVVGEVLFTCLLSFILTSNAPKIASTLLTGQPQLSMGEFMAAAGTMAAGAMMAKNAVATAASPAVNAAKVKAGEAMQRRAAGNAAERKARDEFMQKEYAHATKGIDTSTRKGKSEAKEAWGKYQADHQESIKKRGDAYVADSEAGEAARKQMAEQQRMNYEANGGALGTAGRVFAHYTGSAISPIQTLKGGRKYQSPGDSGISAALRNMEGKKEAPPKGIEPISEDNDEDNDGKKKEKSDLTAEPQDNLAPEPQDKRGGYA